ncbi:Transcriptional repressor tup12-related protein [Histomonas meleagridis]|uniref:Transcriptional repressor tup12-related protein n=1 Tax=Histomonas meleagridis TaxID=135588 RepID=UPI00355ABEB0|nr:Transcriptional repressor tup12-related protein [Histomonas meleagridis]KAH0799505.1 Transcriptional repressor tup12-related protein [Histomonas meleagridis]
MEENILMRGSVEDKADKMNDRLTELFTGIQKLCDELQGLQRIYNQSVIHLLQLQNEKESMKFLYKNLKARYQSILHPDEVIKTRLISQVNPDVYTLSNVPYNVEPNNTNIHLKYAIRTNAVICAMDFSQDGSIFAFSNNDLIFVVSTEDGSLMKCFEIPNTNVDDFNVRAINISPNCNYLAVGGPSNNVIIYSLHEEKIIANLESHENKVSSLMFTNDSKRLYSAGFDGRVYVWDLPTMRSITKIEAPKNSTKADSMVISLSKNSDEDFIVIGFINGILGISEMSLFQPLNTFRAHGEGQYLLDSKVSPLDGTLATVSHDKTCKIWNLRGVATCTKVLTGHSDTVLSVCFAPNSTHCFTASRDERFKAWNYKTGELLFTVKAHSNTVFKIIHHPSENILGTCSGDGYVCIWEYGQLE